MIELNKDEKDKIKQLLMSDGWKTLVEKVWNPMWNMQSDVCCSCTEAHRWEQGILEGMVRVVRYTHQSVAEPQDIANQVYASEAALTSRKYRPAR